MDNLVMSAAKIPTAIYTRYSTDYQNSTKYQIETCTSYAQKYGADHGMQLDIIKVYSDEGESGTNAQRNEFSRLISDAKLGKVKIIILYEIWRGSRDVVDWFTFRKEMKSYGVKVLAATEDIGDLLDPNAFFRELISVGMGQHMVLNTRQKSIGNKLSNSKQGLFMGGNPPLGYDIIDRKYLINEEEAETVRLIFNWYAEGCSFAEITDALHDRRTKYGKRFGRNSYYNILRNEAYIGVFTYGKYHQRELRKWVGKTKNLKYTKLPGLIPRIIDDYTWERVQKRMNDGKRKAKNKAKRNYLLSGLILCAECGSSYIGHTSTNKKGYETRYYCCGEKYRRLVAQKI